MRTNNARWVVTNTYPRRCFPVGFDTEGLVEISTIASAWAVFINPATGERLDCAEFAAQMQADLEDTP